MELMEDMQSIHASAYFNLLKAGSWVEDKIKGALKAYDLTHAQLNALYVLYERDPDPVSASELKNKILVSNPDVTRLLDRLVRKGYVRRETCPDNRRMLNISLTETGKEMFLTAHHSAKQSVGNFFEDQISDEDAGELRRILHKILK